MKTRRPSRNVTGILAGANVYVSPNDVGRAWTGLEKDEKDVDVPQRDKVSTANYEGGADLERRRVFPPASD